MVQTYRPSGKFSPAALLLLPLAVGILGLATSIPYALASFFNPVIYLGVLLPLAWGGLLALAGGWAVGAGRLRNPPLAAFLGLVSCLPGFLLHWIFFYTLIFYRANDVSIFSMAGHESVAALLVDRLKAAAFFAANCQEVLDDMRLIIQEGIWTVKGHAVKGNWLLAIWGVELLLFIGTVMSGLWLRAWQPYSESSGRFLRKIALPGRLLVPYETDDLFQRLSSGELGYLASGGLENDKSAPHLSIEAWYLPELQEDYLTVVYNFKKGKSFEKRTVINLAAAPKRQVDQIIARLGGAA